MFPLAITSWDKQSGLILKSEEEYELGNVELHGHGPIPKCHTDVLLWRLKKIVKIS